MRCNPLKINEVEALVGITRKNIRFYEAEGLLSPRRNSQNGYRDYGETEVEVLRRIKLLRKLGLPLEEIRQMQHGAYTVGDGMRRHLVSLERERQNLEAAIRFCGTLTDRRERLEELEQVVRAGAHGGEEVPFLLSTIHSSKGLEYGRVILMDVADGIFPKTVPEGPEPEQAELDAYEEERRLFYVGMTRAKNELSIVRFRKEGLSCLRRSSFPRHGSRVPIRQSGRCRWRWARTVTPSPPWGRCLCPECGCGTGPLDLGCCVTGTEISPRSPLTAERISASPCPPPCVPGS